MAGLPQEGQAFGRYDIDRRIGRGGMGVVYAAVQRGLGREVALKVLSSDLADNEDYRHRFLREAEVLARLDSPHIIQVHDAGEEDGWLYIATQLVPDGDLQQMLNSSGSLSPELALNLTAQVADGIETAHRAGIIHRDIKPSNVLLRRRSADELQAYVCDLGISRVMDSQHTKTQGVIGTFAYMAPERHEGLDATEASDVYALGCLLWACLSGEAPYRGTDGQVLMGHLSGPVPQLPGTDPRTVAINAILRRSMAKQAAERHRSAAEFQASCEAAAKLGTRGTGSLPPMNSWPAPGQAGPQQQSGSHQAGPQFSSGPQHLSGSQFSSGRQQQSGQHQSGQHQSGPQHLSGPQHQSAPQGFGGPQQFVGGNQWDRAGTGGRSGNDNRLTWAIAGLAALILVIGVVVVVALNMGADTGGSGGDGSGDVANVADSPKDVSTDDFCPAFDDVQTASVDFDAAKPNIQALKNVGTPEKTSESQRNGFEQFVTLVEKSETQSDYAAGLSELSVGDSADLYSFLSHGRTVCP